MSFLSSMLIGIIEKEISAQAPEIEQYIIQLLQTIVSDLGQYVEKKIGISDQSSTSTS